MEKIEKLELYHLPNKLHIAFMEATQQRIGSNSAEKLNMVALNNQFNTAVDTLNAAIKGNRASKYTLTLLELDRKRLKTYSAIRGRLKNTMSCPIEAEREIAKHLHHTLMQRGNIPKENYPGKSVQINILCEKFLAQENKTRCDKIGITHWIEALQQENNTFNETRLERSKQSAELYAGKVTDARAVVDHLYHQITERINAFVVIGQATPEMENFIGLSNTHIKRMKSLRAWQKSMRAGKKRREAERQSQ